HISGDEHWKHNGMADSAKGGDDVIAGDALDNMHAAQFGFVAPYEAIAILGGNDTIHAGGGDDKASGDALSVGHHNASAFAYSDDSVKRPGDANGKEDSGFGNDVIKGGEGNDSLAGDAGAIAGGPAEAVAKNLAIFGESTADVGSDFIKGGEGDDAIAGEALAVSKHSFASATS